MFAAIQSAPKLLIFSGLAVRLVDEYAMMLADDFLAREARHLEEIVVRVEDRSVGGVFGDDPRLRDGFELSGDLGGQQFGRGDVGSDLDDLEHLPGRADDRIVGGLNPNCLSAFADALVLARVEFAAAELGPEFLVVRASD